MAKMNKTICALLLGFAILIGTTAPANAQSYRDRLSNKEKAAVIGGGAAAGAVIGGLLGGKKGAIIGGLIGAGGGTGYVALKGRDDDRYRRYYGRRDFRDSDNWRFERNRRFDNFRGDRGYHAWDQNRRWSHR